MREPSSLKYNSKVKSMEDGNDQSNAEWRHGSKDQGRCISTKKIGEIIIGCGRTRQPQEIWFDVREEDRKYQLVSDNSHSSNDQPAKIQNYGKQPRKPAKRLAGILRKSIVNFNLRKWKATESSGTSLDERIIRADEAELCKKRILMGGKCRPLNLSGALHYDEHGILLPEDIFPAEEEEESETLL